MKDKEAIDQIAPCMKSKPFQHGEYWAIEQKGKKAKEILNKLPRTKLRREKDDIQPNRCKKLWEQGYTDTG